MTSTKLTIIDKNEWSGESNTLGWFPSITVSTTDASKYRMRAAGLRSLISIFRIQKNEMSSRFEFYDVKWSSTESTESVSSKKLF